MSITLTPNSLEILIHYHVSLTAHPRYEVPAVQEVVESFLRADILKPTGQHRVFTTTGKGNAWLADILNTPEPCPAWINSAGKIIDYQG